MRRSWRGCRCRARAATAGVVVALLLAAAVLLAGCGSRSASGSGSGGVSADAYASAVCRAIGPFEREVAERSAALHPGGLRSAAQGKAALERFLSSVSADTSSAVAELHGAGHPAVRNGRAIATTFVALFARLQRAMASAAASAHTLPTGTPDGFDQAATALGARVSNAVSGDLGSGLSVLRSRALEAAAEKAPACHSLQ